jgi:hypothetical protein
MSNGEQVGLAGADLDAIVERVETGRGPYASRDLISFAQEMIPRLVRELLRPCAWCGRGRRKCLVCGSIFHPGRLNQVYCSPSCKNREASRRHRDRHKEEL